MNNPKTVRKCNVTVLSRGRRFSCLDIFTITCHSHSLRAKRNSCADLCEEVVPVNIHDRLTSNPSEQIVTFLKSQSVLPQDQVGPCREKFMYQHQLSTYSFRHVICFLSTSSSIRCVCCGGTLTHQSGRSTAPHYIVYGLSLNSSPTLSLWCPALDGVHVATSHALTKGREECANDRRMLCRRTMDKNVSFMHFTCSSCSSGLEPNSKHRYVLHVPFAFAAAILRAMTAGLRNGEGV